jgi:diguanylate cyclase (GGDEF)-like protein
MGNASQAGAQSGESGVGNLTVYADFNCPFCYALNERLHAMDLEDQVEFRSIQHAPSVSSKQAGFKVLSQLVTEIAEVRRKAPSIRINVPMFRPNSAAASALVSAVNKSEPAKASQLRRRIYRALWVDGQDISDPGLLATLLNELGIKPPADAALQDDDQAKWQTEWDSNREFDHNIPIVISDQGELVIGFPLESELDAFLKTGSMISDESSKGVSEQPVMQRMLVLDDDVQSLQMIIEQMRDVQVEVASDFKGLVASALDHGMPDLVLVNTALIGGIESTDWWRNSTDSDLDTAVPVIFISDDKTNEAEVKAFEAGAADFIARPFHPRVLRARLNMHLQARQSQQELNNIARVDALTSICNRREFDVRLMAEWSRSARAEQSLALLMIDVDKFKEYNDHHGHLRGDECLVAVAKILSDCMQRTGDLIARYGGEEFIALLPAADLEGAMKVAEECLSAVEDAKLPHITSSVSPYVTVSIGVAAMLPIYDKSSTLLIEQADVALYQAKQSGRNRICSFDNYS